MSKLALKPWHIALVLTAVAAAAVSEWAVRSEIASTAGQTHCRVAQPMPAIGSEPGASTVTANYERHAELGWIPTRRSPHYPETDRIPRSGAPWVALFGDGAVAGPVGLEGGALPERISASLDVPVVSFAVAGHDLDKIAARLAATLSAAPHPPRTTLVGFRVDAIAGFAKLVPDPSDTEAPIRLGPWLARLGLPTESAPSACVRDLDRGQVRSWLLGLVKTADASGAELVVSLHAPAAPDDEDLAFQRALHEELDELAIHYVDTWQPDAALTARDQIENAAQQLAVRLQYPANYVWGSRISFERDGNLDHFPTSGFGYPTRRWSWMKERVATVAVAPPAGDNAIVAEVEFGKPATIDDDPRELVIRIGEVAVGRWAVSSLRKRRKDSFFIDEGIAVQRPLELRFEIDGLKSPRELGIREDDRLLGVPVVSLTLRPELVDPIEQPPEPSAPDSAQANDVGGDQARRIRG